jgi:hypothetical protein
VRSAASPTGPPPTIATVSPGFTCPLSTPISNPVGRMSLSMTSASSSAPFGTACRLVSAYGMRTYSAWVPSIRWPRIQPPSAQWEYMPFLHASQRPQEVMHEMRTRSPFLKLETAEPASSMTPSPSCPRMRPSVTVATSPFMMCRSVPQMVVLSIRTIASVGFWIVGRGFSSQERFPGPW